MKKKLAKWLFLHQNKRITFFFLGFNYLITLSINCGMFIYYLLFAYSRQPLETYKRYLKDVAQLLGATSSDAATFSEDMFFFERRLAEVTPDSRDLRPFQAALRMNVSELKNVAPSVS